MRGQKTGDRAARTGRASRPWRTATARGTRARAFTEELSHGLERSRTLNADATRELLERLEAEGLIRGDTHVDLTPEGQALHRSLREYIAGPAVRLLGQFDIHDIETTVRTLQAITKRAAEESSGSAS